MKYNKIKHINQFEICGVDMTFCVLNQVKYFCMIFLSNPGGTQVVFHNCLTHLSHFRLVQTPVQNLVEVQLPVQTPDAFQTPDAGPVEIPVVG